MLSDNGRYEHDLLGELPTAPTRSSSRRVNVQLESARRGPPMTRSRRGRRHLVRSWDPLTASGDAGVGGPLASHQWCLSKRRF